MARHYEHKNYEEYVDLQISRNEAKADRLWMNKSEAKAVAGIVKNAIMKPQFGICHGSRNGKEVELLRGYMKGCEIIGTDIAPSADTIPHMTCQDFHHPRAEWIGKADFIYSNSLDHALSPVIALGTWMKQLKPGGILIIEWSINHGPKAMNSADCFGAWMYEYWQMLAGFGETNCYSVKDKNVDGRWLFVTQKEQEDVVLPEEPEAKVMLADSVATELETRKE